ncbi:MAG: transposase [Pirellulaceae bacterium]
MLDREVISRRNLPHWYVPGAAHFVTYRLFGTIPTGLLRRWRDDRNKSNSATLRLGETSVQRLARAHKQFFAKYDSFLDAATTGAQFLSDDRVAAMVRENLYHHHGTMYHLIAYCIMSNHVHVLLQPIGTLPPLLEEEDEIPSDDVADSRGTLTAIMHSLKSYAAHGANRILEKRGAFWQRESYDHWVRDDDELERIVNYIARNPVTAGLCAEPRQWRYSSAYDRYELDSSESAVLWWPS